MQGPARADTLNGISSEFFYSVHQNLVLALIARISRLTDPARGDKQENLTMESLTWISSLIS
jgi:hypothetical protein